MNAALSLANQGFEIVLVEKEARLGGFANRLVHTIEGADVRAYAAGLAARVAAEPLIQVLTRTLIVGFSGFKGNFTTEVLVGPGMYERKIEHGAVVLATGAGEYQPTEYLYGRDARVVTQVELAERLDEKGAGDLAEVVMIQCVGSRNKDNPNCSRNLLSECGQKCPGDRQAESGCPGLCALSGYADLRIAGGLLYRGPAAGGPVFPL